MRYVLCPDKLLISLYRPVYGIGVIGTTASGSHVGNNMVAAYEELGELDRSALFALGSGQESCLKSDHSTLFLCDDCK